MLTYLLFVILALARSIISEDAPEVVLSQGTLRGTIRSTLKGRSILAFQGIPYAEPPIGEKRFMPPVPLKAWDGILDATKSHSHCPQFDIFFRSEPVHGNEDCLFLNVYTPKISNELLPVIVFIHGGAFVMGNANPSMFGPDILLDKDIILVTLNYRLGALGFLSTEDDIVPGNNGLKDQSLALLWVKDNIKRFGGNPQKITVFGHSAGSASTYFHLLSPLSKDLVFAGISSSGILSAWSLSQKGEAISNARRLAEYLNCPISSNEEMVNCLRKVDALDIINESNKFSEFNYDPCIPFKPVVEIPNDGAFMPQNPVDIIKQGKMANVPLIVGITTDDGAIKSAAIYNDSSLVERLNSNFDKYLPMILFYDGVFSNKNTVKFTEKIKHFYFGDKGFMNSPKSVLTDMVTDGALLYPLRSVSTLHAKHSKKPVYFYLFGYRGSISFSAGFGDPQHDYGVCHGDDLLYILSSEVMEFKPNENDKKMIDLMTDIWFNFASTGKPIIHNNDHVQWKPVTNDDLQYLSIYNYEKVKMEENLYEQSVITLTHSKSEERCEYVVVNPCARQIASRKTRTIIYYLYTISIF
ncbi:hypothetical protein FQR65_LT13354 [Abscondita terminalis]|nr:hypothetical protein FQR65_LT13354 [Abscondita terminalis]